MCLSAPLTYWRILAMVFKRHTLQHHEYFLHDEMDFEQGKEAYMIFFPFWTIFLVSGLASPVFFSYLVSYKQQRGRAFFDHGC